MSEEDVVNAVSFSTLIDWLAGRGFLKQGWRAQLRALQDKIADLAESLPAELKANEDTILDFSFAKAVRDKLAETSERGLLNNLKGEARLWDKIVRAYEAKNLHLGEAALYLVRNAEFEVPHMRSKMKRQQQQLEDLKKQAAEHSKGIQVAQSDFAKECKHLGIQGVDIVKELIGLTEQLPEAAYDSLQKAGSPRIRAATNYYAAFTSAMSAECRQDEPGKGNALLPCLRNLEENLAPPDAGSWPSPEGAHQDREGSHTEANGMSILASDAGEEIELDWDISLDAEEVASENVESDCASPHVDHKSEPAGEALELADSSYRLVANQEYRNALLAELAELQAFLGQCHTELDSATSSRLVDSTGNFPSCSNAELDSWLLAVKDTTSSLTSESFSRLLGLYSSPKFFARLVAMLQLQAGKEAKHFRLLKDAEMKAEQAHTSLESDVKALAAKISSVRMHQQFFQDQSRCLLRQQRLEITGLGKALGSV